MIDVVVGVIQNADGRILLAQRRLGQDFAGKWEFPGGKIEAEESAEQALQRELYEELGIQPTYYVPLITIPWQYGHGKAVRLQAFVVTEWRGQANGVEGQLLHWVDKTDLMGIDFPAANRGIVRALMLPTTYAITGTFDDVSALISKVTTAVSLGAGIIQLRAHLSEADYVVAARALLPVVRAMGATLLLNAPLSVWQQCPEAGLHLSSERLAAMTQRPVSESVWLTASVHTYEQMQLAIALGVDAVLLSPVLPTLSHPDVSALGWDAASALVAACPVPVYALGGVDLSLLAQAQAAGFHGIAGIGAFWKS